MLEIHGESESATHCATVGPVLPATLQLVNVSEANTNNWHWLAETLPEGLVFHAGQATLEYGVPSGQ